MAAAQRSKSPAQRLETATAPLFLEYSHEAQFFCRRKYLAIIEWGWVDMKNSAEQGGCDPQRPKAEVDNTLRDLQNSSYPTKAEFNNCFIVHSKYLLVLKGVSPFCSLFFRSPNITQPCPQVFAVNSSIICSGLHFWRQWFNNFRRAPLLTSLIQYGEDSFQIWWTAAGYGELCVWF